MNTPLAIFAFVIILGILIFIHELGHFITAKWRGVKVLEFGMGYPPRIWSFRRGETEYSINATPLGGFCKMLGEDDPAEQGSLAGKGPLSRIFVLSAGSVMMFIFPIILFSIVYMVPHDVIVGGEGLQVTQVIIDAPAHTSGITPGDEILSIDGNPVQTMEEVGDIIAERLGEETTLTVLRDTETLDISLIPRETWPDWQGPMGVTIGWVNPLYESESFPPWEAVYYGARSSWDTVVAIKDAFSWVIAGEADFTPAGVIGIGQVTSEIAQRGALDLIAWAGFLSIHLGLINLLPIPALDGGRIAFVIIEVLRRGKRVPPRAEATIHLVGFALLITFMLVVSYYDVLRIVRGESILP